MWQQRGWTSSAFLQILNLRSSHCKMLGEGQFLEFFGVLCDKWYKRNFSHRGYDYLIFICTFSPEGVFCLNPSHYNPRGRLRISCYNLRSSHGDCQICGALKWLLSLRLLIENADRWKLAVRRGGERDKAQVADHK